MLCVNLYMHARLYIYPIYPGVFIFFINVCTYVHCAYVCMYKYYLSEIYIVVID